MPDSLGYLSINEQQKVISQLSGAAHRAPLREKIFYSHGDKLTTATMLATSLVFWRSGFRAFNLNKFNRGRVGTLFVATALSSVNGGFLHSWKVLNSLTDLYRSESMWTYGVRSVLVHQIAMFICFMSSCGYTFFTALRVGIIPVPIEVHKKGNRAIGIRHFVSALKPYGKTMAMTAALSSSIMFLIGLSEFKQSRALLAKINRKTLYFRED